MSVNDQEQVGMSKFAKKCDADDLHPCLPHQIFLGVAGLSTWGGGGCCMAILVNGAIRPANSGNEQDSNLLNISPVAFSQC